MSFTILGKLIEVDLSMYRENFYFSAVLFFQDILEIFWKPHKICAQISCCITLGFQQGHATLFFLKEL